jgi:anion-transporting  ArsA/GET3 family ATPase
MKTLKHKQIEVFCGTGGVVKTTLATSRALKLSLEGVKVLLITIDPAKRLKQVLGLDSNQEGEIQKIPVSHFQQEGDKSFDALLMSPRSTLTRIASQSEDAADLDNSIVNILTKPYGGMNEIMAIIEVQYQINTGKYDCVVLDTPPGKHFIDFLQSSKKIVQFFDKSFVEIFKFLGKRITKKGENPSKGFLSVIVRSGVKKLLSYLEKVTGKDFVDDFIDAVSGLYRNREAFLTALKFQEDLKSNNFSNWFLVTSVEQGKTQEAQGLKSQALRFMHEDSYLLINKSLSPYLESWSPKSNDTGLLKLCNSMKARENAIKEGSKEGYKDVLFFPEVLGPTPISHVLELTQNWN